MEENTSWNLRDIFENEEDMKKNIKELTDYMEKIKSYRGKLGESVYYFNECYSTL